MSFIALLLLAQLSVGVVGQEESNYTPGDAERVVIESKNFGSTKGCLIWDEATSPLEKDMMTDLKEWKQSLLYFTERTQQDKVQFTPDVRKLFHDDYSNRDEICRLYSDPLPMTMSSSTSNGNNGHLDPKTVEFKEGRNLRGSNNNNGISRIQEYFHGSKQLSYSPKYGIMEPLLPPLHHPDMCPRDRSDRSIGYIGSLDHLIEDFGHICRNALPKNSQTVFMDLGATYNFHKAEIDRNSPAILEIEKYRRHGIHFDHIYGYEIKKWDTDMVYKTIPKHMKRPLHWINTGVTAEIGHEHNPWTMLLENFHPDDFVVVKLDIDFASIEMPLVRQLLEDTRLHDLVDIFYFEHHVLMDEMMEFWDPMNVGAAVIDGTIAESLELFQNLRKAGIAAHYWI